MAYQMAATTVTLNDLDGHSPVLGFSNTIRRTFAQHFTRFQLCSHGFSALAELLVMFPFCLSVCHTLLVLIFCVTTV